MYTRFGASVLGALVLVQALVVEVLEVSFRLHENFRRIELRDLAVVNNQNAVAVNDRVEPVGIQSERRGYKGTASLLTQLIMFILWEIVITATGKGHSDQRQPPTCTLHGVY